MISHGEVLLRLLLAAFLGGLIGLEREVHGRPAGIRTYLLLCLGSALFMVLSAYLHVYFPAGLPGLGLQVDPGRIAAQAVTGIGFLGAGVIIRYKDTIRGLTTAACVWVVCAIGLAVGAGFYFFSAAVAALTLLALVLLKVLEKHLRKDWFQNMVIVSEDTEGQLDRIRKTIEEHRYRVLGYALKKDVERRELEFTLDMRVRSVHPDPQVLQEVFALPGVKRVNLV
jgi:putative Mg2+ transporter-C (MgtC) family protein